MSRRIYENGKVKKCGSKGVLERRLGFDTMGLAQAP